MSPVEPTARRALIVAAALLIAEAAAYLAVLVLPAAQAIGEGSAGPGIVLFLGGYGLFHIVLAVGLLRRWTHVRGAVIATQAIQLGLAWNLRDLEPNWLATAAGVTALCVGVLVLLPSVTRAIHPDAV